MAVPLEDAPARDGTTRYRSAWVYLFREGRLASKTNLDLVDGVLPAAAIDKIVREAGSASRPVSDTDRAGVPDGDLPFATVVVPTLFRRDDELSRCLGALDALDYPDFEIVVVDNRPEGGPEPSLGQRRRARSARVVAERRPGISAAKNAGAEAASPAKRAVVAFTDDDIVVDSSWLRSLVAPLVTDETLGAVTGLVLPAELRTSAQYWFEEYCGGFGRGVSPITYRLTSDSPRRRVVSTFGADGSMIEELSLYSASARLATGGSMAVRGELLNSVKGFDISLGTGTRSGGGEDLLLCARILMSGAAIRFEPSAVSFHRHRESYPELVRQVRAWGTGLAGMLTALALEDRRHLAEIARLAPDALSRALFRYRLHRGDGMSQKASAVSSFPRRLQLHEMSGMAIGAPLYLRSRLEEVRGGHGGAYRLRRRSRTAK